MIYNLSRKNFRVSLFILGNAMTELICPKPLSTFIFPWDFSFSMSDSW